jgi:hypothetical protein
VSKSSAIIFQSPRSLGKVYSTVKPHPAQALGCAQPTKPNLSAHAAQISHLTMRVEAQHGSTTRRISRKSLGFSQGWPIFFECGFNWFFFGKKTFCLGA